MGEKFRLDDIKGDLTGEQKIRNRINLSYNQLQRGDRTFGSCNPDCECNPICRCEGYDPCSCNPQCAPHCFCVGEGGCQCVGYDPCPGACWCEGND